MNHELKMIHSDFYDYQEGQTTTKEFLDEVDKYFKEAVRIAREEAIKECEEKAEKLSEFDARLKIEPSADFLDGAIAMKKLILKEYEQ